MGLKRDIGQTRSSTNGTSHDHATNGYSNGDEQGQAEHDEPLDMVIVGAGFAGIWLLWRLRQKGFKAKIVEVSSTLYRITHDDAVLTFYNRLARTWAASGIGMSPSGLHSSAISRLMAHSRL